MDLELNSQQIRVLGCLIEKQLSTPEYYPLTLSALVNACNQKSNREPVMSLSDSDVLDAIRTLINLNLGRESRMPGARVVKYEHKLSNTLTQQFDFSQAELAILSVLFVRGPQTVGELRTRTTRMFQFDSLADVDKTLQNLAENQAGPYVKALARQPGRREIRYCHLFSPFDESAFVVAAENQPSPSQTRSDEIAALREEVAELRKEVQELKELIL